jgi:hypothetical protein
MIAYRKMSIWGSLGNIPHLNDLSRFKEPGVIYPAGTRNGSLLSRTGVICPGRESFVPAFSYLSRFLVICPSFWLLIMF